eukprot:m.162463 g.162463  ORF g.162463 m.162463 type:complete len:133 (-) comp12194_c0_seq1:856-1254(-)
MSAGASVRRALKQLAEGWPIVQERGRRDFGSYVQGTLSQRLDRLAGAGSADTTAFVQKEVDALAKLRNSDFKSRYAREEDTTFTGAQGESFGWSKLSAQAQETYNTQSFFDRLFGRKMPSQHTKETAHRPGE